MAGFSSRSRTMAHSGFMKVGFSPRCASPDLLPHSLNSLQRKESKSWFEEHRLSVLEVSDANEKSSVGTEN
jgi:hypothetical protein